MDESVLFLKSELHLWVFYLLIICCWLLRGIEKIWSKELVIKSWSNSNPECFEFEVGCFLQGAWKKMVSEFWWFFRWLQYYSCREIGIEMFIRQRRFSWSDVLYIHVKGGDYFHMIRFDLINVIFKYCFRLELFCFGPNFYTNMFKLIFKGWGKFRNMLPL